MQKLIKKKHFLLRITKILFWILLVLVFMLMLSILGLNIYLKSNKEKVIENVDFLNNGAVIFDQVSISIFKDFPKASIVLKNTKLVDAHYSDHQIPLLAVEEFIGALSLREWRKLNFEVNKFTLRNGVINLYENLDGYNAFKEIVQQAKQQNNGVSVSPITWKTDTIAISLDQILVNEVNLKKGRNIQVLVKKLETDLFIDPKGFSLQPMLDLQVDHLTFNADNGSFLKSAAVSGTFKGRFENNILSIEPFNVKVNQQDFLFNGKIATNSENATLLSFQSDETNLPQILHLLTQKLTQTIAPYEIEKPFPSTTKIVLTPGGEPLVNISFDLVENDLLVQKKPLKKVSLKGKFVNRNSFDQAPIGSERGDVSLELENVFFDYEDLHLESDTILLKAGKSKPAQIESFVKVSGPAKAISDWLENDNFFFKKGKFVFQGNMDGALDDIAQMVIGSNATLGLAGLDVWYQPADVLIPIDSLALYKASGDAEFTILSTTLSRKNDYRMEGGLKNLTALLMEFAKESTSSRVNFQAKRLAWKDFVDFFSIGSNDDQRITKDEKTTKESMKKTFKGIYHKFHPNLDIAIDTFDYLDKINFYNIVTGAHFDAENLLLLEQTSFDLDQGNVTFNAQLDIGQVNETAFDIDVKARNINLAKILPVFDYFKIELLAEQSKLPDDFYLDIQMKGIIDDVEGLLPNSSEGRIAFKSEHHENIEGLIEFYPITNSDPKKLQTKINISGNPQLFNDFFQTDKFFFKEVGRFHLDMIYTGNFSSLDQLLNESIADFEVTDGAVYYEDVDVVFPLNQLEVYLHEDTIDYNLNMVSDYFKRELKVNGSIENVSELLVGNTGKSISTSVNAYSPIIDLDHAFELFETPPDESTPLSNQQLDEKVKTLISSLLNKFNPNLYVFIDTFNITERIQLEGFNTGCNMRDSTHLELKHTDFNFSGGRIALDGEIDIGNTEEEKFTAFVKTKDLDLTQLLYSFDYFGVQELADAQYLGGTLDLELEVGGSLKDLQLITSQNRAVLDFNLRNLKLEEMEVLNQLGKKLWIEPLFSSIAFAPISNKITVKGNRVNIPRMEINSTALNLFIEGHIDDEKNTNLWFSVPIDNLRKLRKREQPFKRGYAATRRKIHIEVYFDKKDRLRKRLRLSKRKFYKKRGNPKQHRIEKQKNKAIRRMRKSAGF